MDDLARQLTADGAFLAVLGREPTPTERARAERALDDGQPIETVVSALLATDEFAESFAAGGDDDYVRSLYFNLFDRNPERPSSDLYEGLLDGGLAPEALPQLILDFARDSEIEAYQAKLSIVDYYTDQAAAGDYVPDQPLTFQDLTSNADLESRLLALDEEFDTLSLDVVGASLGGVPLYTATVGTGEQSLLIVTQQHGDEVTGTEGAFTFLDWLASDDPSAVATRAEVTVTTLVRANPDGFERLERGLGGEPVLDPRRNDANIDLNRSYDPDDLVGLPDAPEAAAIVDLLEDVDPDLVLDYHNQFLYLDEENGLDTMSVLWPTAEGAAPGVVDDAKRAALAIQDSLTDYELTYFTLFPGSQTRSFLRNGPALPDGPGGGDTPVLLVEQRYLEEASERILDVDIDHSALISALSLEAYISMRGVAQSLASGAFDELDPEDADAIPPRSTPIDYDELYLDDDSGPPPPQLSLVLGETTLSEAGGETSLTISRNGDLSEALDVIVATDDADEAVVAVSSITIPAGEASVETTVTAVDDTDDDGDEEVLITARARRADDGRAALTVEDDDTLVEGTDDSDTLVGTPGPDRIVSGAGRFDVATGGDGDDAFVFGAETMNGEREFDIIADYEDGDTIVLEDGAAVARTRDTFFGALVVFEGDRDRLVVFDTDADDLTIVGEDAMV